MTEVDYLVPPMGDFLRKLYGLAIKTTDLDTCSFPEYVDPFDSSSSDSDTMSGPQIVPSLPKGLLGKLKDEPARHPSPQPTHIGGRYLNKSNGNGHRTMRSATLGYIAPEFKGKPDQMKQGKLIPPPSQRWPG
jgi:glutamate dehydrogenase